MIDVTPNTPDSETPESAPADHAAPPAEHAETGEPTPAPEHEPHAVHAAPEPEPEPEEAADEPAAPAAAEAAPVAPPVDTKKKWYVVKVQSGREESIKAAIERKVKIEGLE